MNIIYMKIDCILFPCIGQLRKYMMYLNVRKILKQVKFNITEINVIYLRIIILNK